MRYGWDGQTSRWQKNFVRTTGLKGWWPRAPSLAGVRCWGAADPPKAPRRRSNAQPCLWRTAPSRLRQEAAGSWCSMKRCNVWGIAITPGIGTDRAAICTAGPGSRCSVGCAGPSAHGAAARTAPGTPRRQKGMRQS